MSTILFILCWAIMYLKIYTLSSTSLYSQVKEIISFKLL